MAENDEDEKKRLEKIETQTAVNHHDIVAVNGGLQETWKRVNELDDAMNARVDGEIDLGEDIAELRAALQEATAPKDPNRYVEGFPANGRSQHEGLGSKVFDRDTGEEIGGIRMGRGGVLRYEPKTEPPEVEDYETRQRKERERREAATKAWWDKATEGLPAGLYRDPHGGLVRDIKTGLLARGERKVDSWLLVKFRVPWFAPAPDAKRYKRGEQPVPAYLRDKLPKSAVVLGPCEAPPDNSDSAKMKKINAELAAEQRERRKQGAA